MRDLQNEVPDELLKSRTRLTDRILDEIWNPGTKTTVLDIREEKEVYDNIKTALNYRLRKLSLDRHESVEWSALYKCLEHYWGDMKVWRTLVATETVPEIDLSGMTGTIVVAHRNSLAFRRKPVRVYGDWTILKRRAVVTQIMDALALAGAVPLECSVVWQNLWDVLEPEGSPSAVFRPYIYL